jgi:hypothetical protein
MKDEEIRFNGKKAKQGAVTPKGTKVRVTVRLDSKVLQWLYKKGEEQGVGYQTFLNSFLTGAINEKESNKDIEELKSALAEAKADISEIKKIVKKGA